MEIAEKGRILIVKPVDVFNLLGREIRTFKHEMINVISLDHQNRLINCDTISDGAVDASLLRLRDVFEIAFRNSATFIILVHNHPSGNPEPSESDIEITRKIAKIGKMVGVFLQDHIVVGNGGF
ncbi:MAG: JAB domain-containing protein, partial [Candidatus Hadarchaeaceae archaeon]